MTGDKSHKARSGQQLIASVIAAFAVIVAAILSQERVIDILISALETRRESVNIAAYPGFSGAAVYGGGNNLLALAGDHGISAPGDTSEDNVSKVFLTLLPRQCTTGGDNP